MNGALRLGVAAASRRAGGGNSRPKDPLFPFVVSLLHFDGADGSQVFSDATGLAWTIAGGAPEIDVTHSKFGGSSGLFGSLSDRLSASATVYIPPGVEGSTVGDFCLEFWVRVTDVSAALGIAHLFDSSGAAVAQLTVSSSGRFAAISQNVRLSAAIVVGRWYHLAFSRTGTTGRLFLDGVQQGDTILSSTGRSIAPLRIYVGSAPSGSGTMSFQGHIDDLRVTVGHARYTANFTPPDAPFPNS